MDVNGLRFWAKSGAADWPLDAATSHDLAFCREQRWLRLAGKSDAPMVVENALVARQIADAPARVKDALGTVAFWDVARSAILLARDGGAPSVLAAMSGAPAPTDMTLGADDILYVARPDGVLLIDTRGRWPLFGPLTHASFKAAKLAPRAGGGAWALDAATGRLAAIAGRPLRDGVVADRDFGAFAPADPNLDPPRILPLPGAALPAGWTGKSIAASPQGQLAILAWRDGAAAASLNLLRQCLGTLGGIAVVDRDGPAIGGESAGQRGAETRAGAGDQRIAVAVGDRGH